MRSHEAKERFRHARKLYVDRRFEEALAELDQLKAIYDAYPDLHYLRARCLGKLKRADELREVAALLTERFSDPRGDEILTWFVRRPVSAVSESGPPAEAAFETPVDVATPTADELPTITTVSDTAQTEDEPAVDAEPENLVVEIPNTTFSDPVPTVAPPTEETSPPAASKRPSRRRTLVAACAGLAIAGLTSGSFLVLREGSDAGLRESATAMAALIPQKPSKPVGDQAPTSGLVVRDSTATLTFRPDPAGGYAVEPATAEQTTEIGTALDPDEQVRKNPVPAWKIEIPFKFLFGGVEWDSLFVNLNGNVTFGYAEADAWTEREAGADAALSAVLAAVDSRAAAGRERMIAPLWRVRDEASTRVHVKYADQYVAIAWVDSARESTQSAVTLNSDGSIVFAYSNGMPGDGFAGVFSGIAWAGETLAHAADPEDADDPNVDITEFRVDDAPTVVQFTMTMAAAVPTTVSSGELVHRVTLDTPEGPRQFGVSVTNEPRGWVDWGGQPQTLGYERDGNRLYMYVSKSLLRGFGDCTAHAEAVWRGYDDLYDRVDEPPVAKLDAVLGTTGEIGFEQPLDRGLGSIYALFDSDRNASGQSKRLISMR